MRQTVLDLLNVDVLDVILNHIKRDHNEYSRNIEIHKLLKIPGRFHNLLVKYCIENKLYCNDSYVIKSAKDINKDLLVYNGFIIFDSISPNLEIPKYIFNRDPHLNIIFKNMDTWNSDQFPIVCSNKITNSIIKFRNINNIEYNKRIFRDMLISDLRIEKYKNINFGNYIRINQLSIDNIDLNHNLLKNVRRIFLTETNLEVFDFSHLTNLEVISIYKQKNKNINIISHSASRINIIANDDRLKWEDYEIFPKIEIHSNSVRQLQIDTRETHNLYIDLSILDTPELSVIQLMSIIGIKFSSFSYLTNLTHLFLGNCKFWYPFSLDLPNTITYIDFNTTDQNNENFPELYLRTGNPNINNYSSFYKNLNHVKFI